MTLHSQRTFGLIALAFQFLALTLCTAQYEPPKPKILPLYPRGVHFSIPDEDGITLVAYHAKFNEDFNGLEAGTIARDIVRVKNNRWTYEDHTTRLKIGDIIYLWVHVIYDGLGYNLLDQTLQVTQFYNYDGSVHFDGQTTPGPPTTQPTPSCKLSNTFSNGQRQCAGQLIFEEHFDQLQPNKWRVVKEFAREPDYEFVVYQDYEENVSVKNGELHIKPTLMENRHNAQFIRRGNLIIDGCTGRIGTEECERRAQGFHILPPVYSGLIDTKTSFSFLYGRVEIKAKLPQGDWIYPVLMLTPVEASYGAGYKSGQLRIASSIGNRVLQTSTGASLDGRSLRAGAVVSPDGPVRQDTMSRKDSANYWSNDYHVYELEWTPTNIRVKVDGEEFGSKESPAIPHRQTVFQDFIDRWTGQNAPFDKLFYLSIGIAVGGFGEFPDGATSGAHAKPWRNVESKALLNFFTAQQSWAGTWMDDASKLKVDYVKVWAL